MHDIDLCCFDAEVSADFCLEKSETVITLSLLFNRPYSSVTHYIFLPQCLSDTAGQKQRK
jgi:hypothetical protein